MFKLKSPTLDQNGPAGELEWVFDSGRLLAELTRVGLREELIPHLLEAAERAKRLPDVDALLRRIVDDTLAGARVKPSIPDHPLLPAIAVISHFPQARERFRERGIPEPIVNATLRDLERSIDAFHEAEGLWGFDNTPWIGNHLSATLFEIGRLQYTPGTMGLPFRVYRNKSDGGLVCLAREGLACTPEGWLRKGADGFVTAFSEDADFAQGNAALADSGRISDRTTQIALAEYELVADPESLLLFVHIPKAGKLTDEECGRSFEEAAAFFERHFPELDWKGFGCVTWLLDRELDRYLPPHSNVTAFAHRFFPLAFPNATGRQIVERVLGQGADPATFEPRNSLQKIVVEHLKNGGAFRTTGGFIPRPVR